jgi:hypothetical protein
LRLERPCSHGAAEQRNELAPFHLIELHSVPARPHELEKKEPGYSYQGKKDQAYYEQL